MRHVLSVGLVLTLASVIAPSFAEEPPYTEGTVMEMTFIRTKPGGEDDYLKFLATTWKSLHEQAKKDGLILSYHVISAPAANKDDWDLLLVVEYKNMAALDGLEDKMRPLIEKMAGSSAKANEAATKRGEVREILGGKLCRELILK